MSTVVAGRRMDRTLADFEQACEAHILEEQERIAPDSALIALLCDAVRLSRECVDRWDAPAAAAKGAGGS